MRIARLLGPCGRRIPGPCRRIRELFAAAIAQASGADRAAVPVGGETVYTPVFRREIAKPVAGSIKVDYEIFSQKSIQVDENSGNPSHADELGSSHSVTIDKGERC